MNMNKLITIAAVAASAMAANAATENITFTTNGVTWRIRLEPEADSYLSEYGSVGKVAGTAMLGINTSCNNVDNWRNSSILAIADQNVTVDASLIPWQFDYNGTHYTVTKIALAAFNKYNATDAKLTGTLTIPDSVTEIRNRAFNNQTSLTGFSGGRNVKFWGNTTGGGSFATCSNMVGVYPDMSQAVVFGASVFEKSTKMTGTLVLSDMLRFVKYYAFQTMQISGAAVIPASVDTLGGIMGNSNIDYGVFRDCTKLEAIWVKGKPTAASQTYTTVYCASFARYCGSMKMILMGRNTKGAYMTQTGDQAMLKSDTGVQVFVPANGYWNGLVAGGSNNTIWYYGPDQEFDLEIDDDTMEATITPTTANALANALAWAPQFKTYFNLDAHISVTNTLDFTDITITEDMVSGVTFDRLVFSAKTQTQLDAILETFPATTPISIDPTGLTENMVIPDGYSNVHVKTVPGVKIRRTVRGFVIFVK